MTEHVHEWRIDAYRDDDNELTIGVFCWHKGCNEQRSRSEAEAMLNATERLSAEAERIRVTWYRVPLGGGDDTIHDLYHEMMSFVEAYVNILEGKDD